MLRHTGLMADIFIWGDWILNMVLTYKYLIVVRNYSIYLGLYVSSLE